MKKGTRFILVGCLVGALCTVTAVLWRSNRLSTVHVSAPADDAWSALVRKTDLDVPDTGPTGTEPRPDISEPLPSTPDSPTETSPASSAASPENDDTASGPATKGLVIRDRLMSSGFASGSGVRSVDTVVMHSTYNPLGGDEFGVDRIIGIYRSYGVSSHYLIARDGTVYRLVRENDIAYHAGVSKMRDGRADVNGFSIGIELVGNEDSGYTDAQYAALNALIGDIRVRHDIRHILGHDDIAPGRKTDPWGFDWARIGGKKL